MWLFYILLYDDGNKEKRMLSSHVRCGQQSSQKKKKRDSYPKSTIYNINAIENTRDISPNAQ
jgi:hypothetical protein